ncbi:MAG TPA: RIP metalloprotease RseP [Planctomycetota bacterium]|nr:RIP metalloprotease RseP [Planctomycetota bacterium]
MNVDSIIRVVEIFVGIGLLIAVHELGHFLAAKWAGVRVEKFAIGMGPKLLWFVRGGTEYSLRVIPFGGFCAMSGEAPGAPTTDEPLREFRNQPPGKKAVILLAGVSMNFVLAIVLFSIALGVGLDFTRPLVGLVHPGSPAEKAGLLPGDQITAINGQQDVDWEDVLMAIVMGDLEDNVSLTVARQERKIDFTVRPRKSTVTGLPEIGIEPATGRTVTRLERKGPADEAGLREGDVIDAVDGLQFLRWEYALCHMSSRMGRPVTLDVMRAGKPVSVSLVPRPGRKGAIGVTPARFPVVAGVAEDSPAARADVRTGDEVLAIDGTPTPTFDDLIALTAPATGRPLVYRIRRGEETFDVTLTPERAPGRQIGQVGIRRETKTDFTVGAVEPGSPAEAAGLKPGDVLTHVDDASLEKQNWSVFQNLLDAAAESGGKVTLGWRRGEVGVEKKAVTVKTVEDPLRADVGITVNPAIQWERKYSPWRAPVVGLKKSWQVVQQVYLFLRGMLTRRISPKHAAGPVGIIKLSYRIASRGIIQLVYWMAILGVNLAVVNLLPMTPLDGGLLVLTGVEKLRGRRISEKWFLRLQLAGWCVVLVLFTLITINDILR